MRRFKRWLLREAKEEYAKVVLSLLEQDKEARLLDLASGDYILTGAVIMKVLPKEVCGIDLVCTNPIKEVRSITGDLNQDFPLEDKSYDIVVASQIIEHLSETDNFLREIHRVLKPTGYAIISTPNLASWHNILYLLFAKQPRTATVSDEMDWSDEPHGPTHRRLFTVDGLVRLLQFHKFKVEKVICSGYYPLPIWLTRGICKIDRGHSVIITAKVRRKG